MNTSNFLFNAIYIQVIRDIEIPITLNTIAITKLTFTKIKTKTCPNQDTIQLNDTHFKILQNDQQKSIHNTSV